MSDTENLNTELQEGENILTTQFTEEELEQLSNSATSSLSETINSIQNIPDVPDIHYENGCRSLSTLILHHAEYPTIISNESGERTHIGTKFASNVIFYFPIRILERYHIDFEVFKHLMSCRHTICLHIRLWLFIAMRRETIISAPEFGPSINLDEIISASLEEYNGNNKPTLDYRINELISETTIFQNDFFSHNECSICLEKFIHKESSVCNTPCKHLFHPECLSTWLLINHTCPICRYDLNN